VGSQHSNTNLLDNWYFLDPINQRGQKEYAGVGHTIDRWYSGIENTKTEVLESGLRLTAEAGRNSWWIQKIEGRAQFVNKVCTLSILTADNNLYCLTATLKNQNATNEHYDRIFSWGGLVWQFYGANEDTARFVIYPNMNKTITLIAAKLELGPVQTLAHKEGDTWVLNDPPPNKALELAKCQRYQIILKGNGNAIIGTGIVYNGRVYFGVPIPTTMRNTPAITVQGNIHAIGSQKITSNLLNVVIYGSGTANILKICADDEITLPEGDIVLIQITSGGTVILDSNL